MSVEGREVPTLPSVPDSAHLIAHDVESVEVRRSKSAEDGVDHIIEVGIVDTHRHGIYVPASGHDSCSLESRHESGENGSITSRDKGLPIHVDTVESDVLYQRVDVVHECVANGKRSSSS